MPPKLPRCRPLEAKMGHGWTCFFYPRAKKEPVGSGVLNFGPYPNDVQVISSYHVEVAWCCMKQVLWPQTSSSAWKWLPDTSCIHLTTSSQSKIKRPCQWKADDIWHHLTPHIPTCLGKHTQEVGHQEVTRLVTGHSLRIFFAHQATQGVQQQQLTWDEMPAGCKQHDPSGAASELRKKRKRNLLGLLIAGLYTAIWFCDPRSDDI